MENQESCEILKRLSLKCDVFIDPFMPGHLEKFLLGPDELCQQNPGLIYARLSSFGQKSSISHKTCTGINIVAVSGIMSRLGINPYPPIAPVNLLADISGGSVMCALGILMALYDKKKSGLGQVIDHSVTEGTAYVSSFIWESFKYKDEIWPKWPNRGENLLDYGSPFYRCYECLDGKFLAVGALEEKFYQNFIKVLGIDENQFNRFDITQWSDMIDTFSNIIKTKSRNDWNQLFENIDACVIPVLDMDETINHKQHIYRNSFDPKTGYPNPAPKFSRTPALQRKNLFIDEKTSFEFQNILKEFGCTEQEIKQFISNIYC